MPRSPGFEGANFSVNTFLTERINETISGYTAPVVVNIFGNDLGALDRAAQQVSAVLGATRGARGVRVQAPQGSPRLSIRLRKGALARWGIAPEDALAAIQTAYQGMVAAQVYQGTQIYDVSVIFPPTARRDPAAVGALTLKNPDGILVPLKDIADIRLTTGRFLVLHQAAQRVQTVTAQLSGRSLSAFVRDAEQRIHAQVKLPPSTYVVFSGAAQERSRATRDLMLKSGIAAVAILLLLFIALGSLRSLALVLVNLPFAFVGGVLLVLATGRTLSLGSLIGFVTLFGITVRNAIMLISHYQHLVRVEGMT